MPKTLPPVRRDVAPTHHAIFRDRHELHDSVLPTFGDEIVDLIDGRGLHHGEVAPFPGDEVEALVKARNVSDRDAANLHLSGFPDRRHWAMGPASFEIHLHPPTLQYILFFEPYIGSASFSRDPSFLC